MPHLISWSPPRYSLRLRARDETTSHSKVARAAVWLVLATLPIAPEAHAKQPPPKPRCSAQLRWSQLRAGCLRPDLVGVRLAKQGARGTPAFVVFGRQETGPAELFLPSQKNGLWMRRVTDDGAGTWKAGGYTLSQWRGMYSLDDRSGHVVYQGPVNP